MNFKKTNVPTFIQISNTAHSGKTKELYSSFLAQNEKRSLFVTTEESIERLCDLYGKPSCGTVCECWVEDSESLDKIVNFIESGDYTDIYIDNFNLLLSKNENLQSELFDLRTGAHHNNVNVTITLLINESPNEWRK